ncbi:MAG: hypothetical protein JRF28_07375 [Deltaproteobacteria bacterium]|nr:hypothetical protein [Deltaproteobacteria bacterium]
MKSCTNRQVLRGENKDPKKHFPNASRDTRDFFDTKFSLENENVMPL